MGIGQIVDQDCEEKKMYRVWKRKSCMLKYEYCREKKMGVKQIVD